MQKLRTMCLTGLILFVTSYIFFAKGSLSAQRYIDLAHWFNLIGAVFLLTFNFVFPKNKLSWIASVMTAVGVIAHIGLCTIDFIMWSYGNDDIGRNELGEQIRSTPSILYPFVIVGPSFLFLGLASHALPFLKTSPVSSLMVVLGGASVGLTYFVWNNGTLMLISCLVFAIGLVLLMYRSELRKWDQRRKYR